jgi:hypothetical protein
MVVDDVASRTQVAVGALEGTPEAERELDRRQAQIDRWVAHNGDHWRNEFDRACAALPKRLRHFADQRSEELLRQYDRLLPSLKPAKLRDTVEVLQGAPADAVAEMMTIVRADLSAATRRIGELLDADRIATSIQTDDLAAAVAARLGPLEPTSDSETALFDTTDLVKALEGVSAWHQLRQRPPPLPRSGPSSPSPGSGSEVTQSAAI